MSPAEAYLGGHQVGSEPNHLTWKDKICKDDNFQELCLRIYYSAVPTKARLAKLFEYSGFELERE